MNIVYGFGGMRGDGQCLAFRPTIPASWKGYSFRVTYHEAVIEIQVTQEQICCRTLNGRKVIVRLYGKVCELGPVTMEVPIVKGGGYE